MSERERDPQRALLLRKLRALVDCVIAQADKDAEFAEKLGQILLDEKSEAPPSKSLPKQPGQAFNPVLFLKEHGEAALLRELETQTDDGLRTVLRFQGLRKGKELKRIERRDMVREIVDGAKAKLRQGLVVAQLGTPEARERRPPEQDTQNVAAAPAERAGMGFSEGTRKVLRFLISRWKEASEHERDPDEREAFAAPIDILTSAMDRPVSTHQDIRRALQVCPAYPNFARRTLAQLADAERDGRAVNVVEQENGTVKWDVSTPE